MLADMGRSDLQTWVREGGDQARGSTRLNQGGCSRPFPEIMAPCVCGEGNRAGPSRRGWWGWSAAHVRT